MPATDFTMDEFARLWLREVKATKRASTAERYTIEYRVHVAPVFGTRRLASITRAELKAHVVTKVEEGLHPKFLLAVLSMIFAAAHEDGYLDRNPATKLRKTFDTSEKKKDIKTLTDGELSRFLKACASTPPYDGLFRTMAYAGLRLGEARALRGRDVVTRREMLDVVRTFSQNDLSDGTKTVHSTRRIEIPTRLAEELRERAAVLDPDAWIFFRGDGCALRQKACQYAFSAIARRAKIPSHHTTHCLRHTYSTKLLERGASLPYLQRQLGHHSIQLTNDTYGRWAKLSNREAINRFMEETDVAGPNDDDGEQTGGDEHAPRLRRHRSVQNARVRRSYSVTRAASRTSCSVPETCGCDCHRDHASRLNSQFFPNNPTDEDGV